MNVKIRIDRAAAIRAGRDRFGDTVVAISPADLTLEERELLAAAPECDGAADLTAPIYVEYAAGFREQIAVPMPTLAEADDPLAAARVWLAWREVCAGVAARKQAERRVAEAERRGAAEAACERFVAWAKELPAERFIRDAASGSYVGLPPRRYGPGAPEPQAPSEQDYPELRKRALEALADKIAAASELIAQRDAQAAERKEAAERAKREAAERRAEQLATWVRERGTENQQGRFKLGLLPETEILDGIRAELYRPLDGFARYGKIKWADIEHGEQCFGSDGGIDCSVDPAEGLSAGEYERYAEIQRLAPPGAVLEALAHSCTCNACGSGLVRRSVRVAIAVGELSFTREYALAD